MIRNAKRTRAGMRSEERYRCLSEASFEGIVIHDKGRIMEVNNTFAEMFGYKYPEVIGMHALQFTSPESRDSGLQNIVSGYEGPYEAVCLRKDGSTFTAEIRGKSMKLVSHLGHPDLFLKLHKDMKVGECLCGLAVKTGEIIISKNSDNDIRHTIRYPGIHSHGHIIIPLKARYMVVGVLYLYLPADFDIDESRLNLLTSIGNQIGIAIDNAKLYEETKALSLLDPLTGLANRRMMDILFEKYFAGTQRSGTPLSVIMLDIDHFKKYNDTHGHDSGDKLLAGLAKLLLSVIREVDLAVRYGGEEFLILLPETDLIGASEIAERIRGAVEATLAITVSLGVASCNLKIKKQEKIIKKADEALYRAKKRGRNRVDASRR